MATNSGGGSGDKGGAYTILVIGQVESGKTKLVERIVSNRFEVCYTPTLEDNFECTFATADGRTIPLRIIDTSGERDFFRSMWKSWFVQAGGILIVYSVTSMASFQWALKVIKHLVIDKQTQTVKLPFALVGTRADLAATQVACV